MTIMAKKELVSATKPRYLKADKQGKSKILDEFCHNTGYARKYAIKILASGYDNNRVAKVGRNKENKGIWQRGYVDGDKNMGIIGFPLRS